MERVTGPRWLYAAVAVALVAGGATAAVRLRHDGGTAALTTRSLPRLPGATATPSATPSPSGTPSETPTATPTPAVPTAVPTGTVPATAPPVSSPLPVVTGGPGPTSTATAPPVQDGHWRYTSKGVTLDVRISPTNPRAGDLVTWTYTTSASGGQTCCHVQTLYGDHQGAPEDDEYCLGTRKFGRAPGGGVVQHSKHAYRRGGTYTPWIAVIDDCEGEGVFYFTFKPTLRVADGPLLSNGPWVPVGYVDDGPWGSGEDPDAAVLVSYVFDHDGSPLSWRWDFGDGTRSPLIKNPDGCHWPKDGGWIEQRGGTPIEHRYTEPGTYTVRFTATTAGCDGKNPQTFTTTFVWTQE